MSEILDSLRKQLEDKEAVIATRQRQSQQKHQCFGCPFVTWITPKRPFCFSPTCLRISYQIIYDTQG